MILKIFLAFTVVVVITIAVLRYYLGDSIYFESHWMDSPTTIDPALQDASVLLSNRIPDPTLNQNNQPVCILVHGFSASSFEWQQFLDYAVSVNETILFSTVVMGGHGRHYDAFKVATYQDWVQPVIDELNRLQGLGYTNISLFGLSAGATSILNMFLSNQVSDQGVRQIILMDPFIIPKDKRLFWVHILGLFVKNSRSNASTDIEFKHWNINRPTQSLNQLRQLVINVQTRLNDSNGDISLPPIHIFTSKYDSTADTNSAEFIQQRVSSKVSIDRYDSKHHVLIESKTKLPWTKNDDQILKYVNQELMSLF